MASNVMRTGLNAMLTTYRRTQVASQALLNCKYTPSHEWIRMQPDGNVAIGITSTASKRLGRVVFMDLPKVGDFVGRNNILATVESFTAFEEVIAPDYCEVIEVNKGLNSGAEILNSSGEDWILKAKIAAPKLERFMDFNEYELFCQSQLVGTEMPFP